MNAEEEKFEDECSDGEVVNALVTSIVDYVNAVDSITFANLSERFPCHFSGGRHEIVVDGPDYGNIVLWQGLSKTGVRAMQRILTESLLDAKPTKALTYILDGAALMIPVAKSVRCYKKPHWLPTVFNRKKLGKAVTGQSKGAPPEGAPRKVITSGRDERQQQTVFASVLGVSKIWDILMIRATRFGAPGAIRPM